MHVYPHIEHIIQQIILHIVHIDKADVDELLNCDSVCMFNLHTMHILDILYIDSVCQIETGQQDS